MQNYDPRTYWSRVANEIARRPAANVIAGDDTPFYAYKRRKMLTQFIRTLETEGREILEVGCGPGGNLHELARNKPKRLVGCDISSTMLDIARVTTAGLPVELVEISGDSLPFSEGEFATTFTVTVLQHNVDSTMMALISEMCRISRQSVCLIEEIRPIKDETYAFVARPVSEYAAVCESHGWKLVNVQPLHIAASEWVARRLRDYLNPPSRAEGEPVARRNETFERFALPVTRLLDPIVRSSSVLTKMTFNPTR